MPRYVYQCQECEKVFQIVHSIKERYSSCEECCDCKEGGGLNRIPSIPLTFKFDKKQKVGTIVKEYINDTKKEVKKEKERLKKVEFEK